MPEINFLAIALAAVAALVVSMVWYVAFATPMAALSAAGTEQTPPWKVAVELARSGVLALVLAYLAVVVGADSFGEALRLGAVLFVGFPALLLLGSVLWEKVPLKLAAIHAGDWLVKVVALTLIVSLWR